MQTQLELDIIKRNPDLMVFYSTNYLPNIKDGEFAINLDKYQSIVNHSIALYTNGDNVIYYHSFGTE